VIFEPPTRAAKWLLHSASAFVLAVPSSVSLLVTELSAAE